MRLVLAMALCCAALCAQSWDAVKGIAPGRKMYVSTASARFDGDFVKCDDTSVTVLVSRQEKNVARTEVRKVALKGGRRGRHALIGAGIGAGAGALVAIIPGDFYYRSTMAAVGAVAGALVGAGIGSLMPGHITVYDSRKP